DRRVTHQDAEAIGRLLDVVEQRERSLFEQVPRMAGRERRAHHREQLPNLAIDDDGVQPFLATEVLVDDRLGHLSARRDLLDGGSLEPARREQSASNLDQLLATLGARHARALALRQRFGVAHVTMLPDGWMVRSRNGPIWSTTGQASVGCTRFISRRSLT